MLPRWLQEPSALAWAAWIGSLLNWPPHGPSPGLQCRAERLRYLEAGARRQGIFESVSRSRRRAGRKGYRTPPVYAPAGGGA